jgi:hypothetical protein
MLVPLPGWRELVMSVPEITVALTGDQVAKIMVAASGGRAAPRLGWLDPVALASTPLLGSRRLSRSLILGVAVLVSFPVDGELRRLREVALELGQPEASVHRYARTWLEIGILRQDPATRRYGRVGL